MLFFIILTNHLDLIFKSVLQIHLDDFHSTNIFEVAHILKQDDRQ